MEFSPQQLAISLLSALFLGPRMILLPSYKRESSILPIHVSHSFASPFTSYVELTQLMTSVHDILYPSRERTIALAKMGEYHKYLDEFKRSLEAFRRTWEGKFWGTYPLTEVVWITFVSIRSRMSRMSLMIFIDSCSTICVSTFTAL